MLLFDSSDVRRSERPVQFCLPSDAAIKPVVHCRGVVPLLQLPELQELFLTYSGEETSGGECQHESWPSPRAFACPYVRIHT